MKTAGAAIAGLALGSLFTGFIEDARESARVSRLTAQVIKTTGGVAHVTAQQVGDLAEAISNKTGVDDEAIQSASNLLLTFTRVRNEVGKGNDVFDQATQAAVDMAAVLGGDASAQAKLLGKALNDPIKGLTALSRAGVSFTEQQKEQIKTLVESGDILSAQKIILQELGTEFGGAAEAAADPLQRLGTIAGNLGEDIGALLLPVISEFASFVGDDLIPAVRDVAGFLADLPGPIQAAAIAGAAWAIAGDGILRTLRPLGGLISPLRGTVSAFGEALSYARANGDGLGTVLKSVGSYAGGQALSGIRKLAHAIGPELGIAVAVFAVGELVKGFQLLSSASDEATAAAEGLAGSLTLIDQAADRRSVRTAIEDVDGLVEALEGAGVSSQDAINGLLGQEDALNRVTRAIEVYMSQNVSGYAGGDAAEVRQALNDYKELATGYGNAASSARFFADESPAAAEGATATGQAAEDSVEQIDEATEALQRWLEKLQGIASGFVEPLNTYKQLLSDKQEAERASAEATAAATADSSDSWEDYATDVSVSLDEFSASLEEQLENQANWRDNLALIAQEAGIDVANYLAEMGEDGIDLVAEFANGSDEEMQRAAEAIRRDIEQGGEEWTAELDQQLNFMDAVGRAGARATVAGIAAELGLGTNEVRRIAAQYGVELAGGVNPILSALGKGTLRFTNSGVVASVNAEGNLYEDHSAQIAPGGTWRIWAEPETGGEAYIPLSPSKRGRSTDIWREVGNRLGVDFAEFADGGFLSASDVPRPYSTAPYRAPISTAGDAAMQKEYDTVLAFLRENSGGVPGSGSLSGSWVSIWNAVKAAIPLARINSTFRLGDPGYHGLNKAIDFGYGSGPGGAGSAGLAQINRFLYDNYGSGLAELIYDGLGDDRPDIKNGRNLVYSASTQAEHQNHVHAAVYDQGGLVPPGLSFIDNRTGGFETIRNPQQEAALGSPVFNVRVFVGNREITDIARVEAEQVVDDAFGDLTDRAGYAGLGFGGGS